MKQTSQVYNPCLVQAAWISILDRRPPDEQYLTEQSKAQAYMRIYGALQELCKISPSKRKPYMVEDILSDNKIPPILWTYIKDLLDSQQSIQMDAQLKSNRPGGLKLIDVSWKVNVVVCSSSISKVLQPLVELTLFLVESGDSRSIVLELDLHTFHKLRHTVATLLKHLIRLQSRPSLK